MDTKEVLTKLYETADGLDKTGEPINSYNDWKDLYAALIRICGKTHPQVWEDAPDAIRADYEG